MADTFDWSVIIRLAAQGAKGVTDDVKQVSGALSTLQREGKVTEKVYDQTSKSLSKMGDAGRKASSDLASFSSPSLRYALYDVASTASRVSLAITGIGTAAVVAGAQYERAFANVQRTLEPGSYSVEKLRGELLQLSREIPQSFGNISEIATLGNQLGIAGQDVTKFTETVAQFSAVTGMSVNETSLAFGQLGNLLGVSAKDYDRLGSSIALVGVNSAATESQIVSIARELAPAASAAGFTAEQVVGLSGALGSLKVPPERSRSTILQFFETLNMATAEGGQKLEDFAQVVGVSAQQLDQMVRSGQGEDILRKFIGNISTADTVQVTQALENLGLAGLRTNPTIRALAGNMELLDSTMSDSKRGWDENSELARQYGIIVETLSSKWQLFLNGLSEFGAAIGTSVGPAVASFLDIATDVLNALTDFVGTPVGQFIAQWVASIAALVAAFGAVSGVVAGSMASLVALRFAVQQLGWANATGGVRGFAASLVGLKSGAAGSAGAVSGLGVALRSLGKATIILGVIQLIIDAFTDLGGTAAWAGGVIRNLGAALGVVSGALPSAFKTGAKQIEDFGTSMESWGKQNSNAKKSQDELNETMAQAEAAANAATGAYDENGAGLEDLGGNLDDTAAKVRTLVDYANDLSSVWNRAFEIRFSGQSTLDAISKTFLDMRDAAEQSRRAIAGLQADIQGLNSDMNIQQQFLNVAIQYGDTTRAQAIQAKMADLQSQLADKTAQLNAEQEKNNKTLTGNSAAAIANRGAILGLVQQYQAHIQGGGR